MQSRRLELGLACALALPACQAPLEPPDSTPEPIEPTHFGEYVTMGIGDGLPICGRSFEYAERFAELYIGGSKREVENPVSYYYVDAETIARPDICGSASACARQGVVYAPSPIHTHEMVHALRQEQHGLVMPGLMLLEEGFAQWHYPNEAGWSDDFAPSQLADHLDGGVPRELYDPAAQLVSGIADTLSPELAEAFVDASGEILMSSDVQDVVEATLGMTIGELDNVYAAYPNCSAAARARLLVDCANEPEMWAPPLGNGGPWVVVGIGAFTCDDPRVLGPLGGRAYASYAIDVPEDGTYTLFVDVDVPQRLQMVSCDATCGEDIDLQWDDDRREEELSLTAGRYVVRLSREFGDEAAVGFRLYAPT